MTVSDLKNRCYRLLEGLYWAGDCNYSPFERQFLDCCDDLDKIFDEFMEELK